MTEDKDIITNLELVSDPNNVNNPIIFSSKKNFNPNIRSSSYVMNSLGETRHFPSSTKEWLNSIYSYNSVYTKNLLSADKNLTNVLKGYFNLYFNRKVLNDEKIATRFRRISFNRIFISKAEIKHTAEKINITLYIYNEEKRLLMRKIKRLETSIFPSAETLSKRFKTKKVFINPLSYKIIKAHSNANYSFILTHVLPFINTINSVNKLISQLSAEEKTMLIKNLSTVFNKTSYETEDDLLRYIFTIFNSKFKDGSIGIDFSSILNNYHGKVALKQETLLKDTFDMLKKFYIKYEETLIRDMPDYISLESILLGNVPLPTDLSLSYMGSDLLAMVDTLNKLSNTDNDLVRKAISFYYLNKETEQEKDLISYYKLLIALNNSKFEYNFLSKIKPLIVNLYNKEVEFNIVNLKTLCFNSDMFTEAITVRLRNRDNRLLKVLNSALKMVKLPRLNKIREKYGRSDKGILWLNKIKNLRVNSLPSLSNKTFDKDLLSQFIFDLLSTKSLSMDDKNLLKDSLQSKTSNPTVYAVDKDIENTVFSTLKHKIMGGARLEAKGRLTKRFTASRAVFKVKWKGGLKNIDSSYKGMSSVLLRGHVKSNVQYSVFNSKTRNGAFGLKGWIGSK